MIESFSFFFKLCDQPDPASARIIHDSFFKETYFFLETD